MYKLYPNLQCEEFPFFIEVITLKNGNSYQHRWFSISTTTIVNKSSITTITKCCDGLIVEFNSMDMVYFYLDQKSIESMTKVIIKSHIFYRFIEIIEYLATITKKNKCTLIDCEKRDFPSQGNDQVREDLNVRPSRFELKNTIKGYMSDAWVKRFNSTTLYRQTKTFISEPSEIVSKDLLRLLKQTARNVIAFLTGFGPFMKHFYQMDPKFYKTDKCQVCKEDQ